MVMTDDRRTYYLNRYWALIKCEIKLKKYFSSHFQLFLEFLWKSREKSYTPLQLFCVRIIIYPKVIMAVICEKLKFVWGIQKSTATFHWWGLTSCLCGIFVHLDFDFKIRQTIWFSENHFVLYFAISLV